MRILYLAEDYVYSKVHHNLCSNLIKIKDIDYISVFGVLRDIGTPRIDGKFGKVEYDVKLVPLNGNALRYRADFAYKVRKKMVMLSSAVNVSRFDVTYAATVFSEGIIAYKLYKKYGIPYVVAVRGTDINEYLKLMPHLWHLAVKILNNASHVIFINSLVKGRLRKHWAIGRFIESIDKKYSVLPNGIDEYWLNNVKEHKKIAAAHNLLYVGIFDCNKNVEALQKAVLKVREKSIPDLRLTLVGGGSKHHDAVIDICRRYPDVFDFKGKIFDKGKLADIMADCDAFAMVSHSETFGLVYIEALSQGLPIIYSKGQGVDGYFEKKVGVSVDSHSNNDIERGIIELFENYNKMEPIGEELNNFCWSSIAEDYFKIIISAYASK